MTYCVAMALQDGLVFASDSRTNAGVDQIATYRKLHKFVVDDERVIIFPSLRFSNGTRESQCDSPCRRMRMQPARGKWPSG